MAEKKIRIVTHSGTFHADELLAVAALEIMFAGAPYEVVRSRDPEVIKSGDYVVDVGGVYDPKTNRFDHHQHGGAGERPNGIPYSAFGLVWKHYGEKIAGSKAVADAVDKTIGHPIDMGDNGMDYYKLVRLDTEPLILQSVVGLFRPTWSEKASYDDRFLELVAFLRRFLELTIKVERDKKEGEALVEAAYKAATDKRMIILDGSYPWQEALAAHPEPLYVVKPKSQGVYWEVECVRDNPYGFENRKKLPDAWAGLFDTPLADVTGVSDAIFCHNKRYIAVAESKEGALKLAALALAA